MRGSQKSVRTLLIAVIVGLTALIFAVLAGYTGSSIRSYIVDEIGRSLTLQAGEEAQKLYGRIVEVGKCSELLALNVAAVGYRNSEQLLSIAKKYVEEHELLCGSGIWLEPYLYDENTKYYGPYMYKDPSQGRVELTWVYSNADYDYFQYDWYKIGLNAEGKTAWTEPFLDEVSGIYMITCSSPIRVDGRVIGVATADIGLDNLREYVRSIKVGKKGYAFVVTRDGYFLGSREPEKDLKQKITEDEGTREIGKAILSGESGVRQARFQGEDCFVSFASIGDTGMKLVEVLPQAEAFASLNNMLKVNMLILIIALAAFVILLSTVLQRKVIRPLNAVMSGARKVAEGDLAGYQAEKKEDSGYAPDELGQLRQSFDGMVDSLRGLILRISDAASSLVSSSQQLKTAAEQSAAVSEQIAATTNELTEGVSEQARLTQDGSRMVSEMLDQLKRVVQNLEASEEYTRNVDEAVENGREKISYQKQKMEENKEKTLGLEAAVSSLGEKSRQIGDIVGVIVGIADQTNLLALNAAIEAARAGEQGRGFAVVAEEVRKLAEQSAQATREIRTIIEEIQNGIDSATAEMKKAISAVGEQETAVEFTSQAFNRINEAIRGLLEEIRDVSRMAAELSRNAEEVKTGIERVAEISQESAAGTEELAASTEEQTASDQEISRAAEQLAELAAQLQEQVKKFKL
jgi:methyl-accepting chemotaxis protein